MFPADKSNKQKVRDWLAQRQADRKPIPTLEQIRRELGWKFNEGAARAR